MNKVGELLSIIWVYIYGAALFIGGPLVLIGGGKLIYDIMDGVAQVPLPDIKLVLVTMGLVAVKRIFLS